MKSSKMKIIAALLPFIGAVFGIVLGFACQINVETKWYNSADYVFNTGLMLETWIFFDLLGIFFSWLASVLQKLENIERSICGTTNTYSGTSNSSFTFTGNNSNYSHVNTPQQQAGAGEWKCPSCGRINQNYVGTCGCGQVKEK